MVTLLKKAVLAGAAIGLGCIAYVSVDNKYMGAFLFSIGLLTICGMGWNLFTGKLCKCTMSHKELALVCLGNLLGSIFMCACFTLSSSTLSKAYEIAEKKFNRPIYEGIISAVLCEICIYIAVVGYKQIQFSIGKYLAVILGVMVFILCGFEHCVADMFYYFVYLSPANWPYSTLYLLAVIFGNIIGACLMNIFDSKTKCIEKYTT